MNFIFNQGPSLNSRCKSTHHVHDLCLHQDKRRSFTRRRVSEIYLTLNVFVVLKYYTHKCQFASILDLWPLGGQEIDLWYIVKRHIIACEPSIQKCNVKLKHYWPTLCGSEKSKSGADAIMNICVEPIRDFKTNQTEFLYINIQAC